VTEKVQQKDNVIEEVVEKKKWMKTVNSSTLLEHDLRGE
jgi:hypothetical protein